jgi:hypothetical protein
MKEARKQVWVDPFQSKLFWRMVGYGVVYQFTLWNFLFAWRLLEEGKGNLLEQYGRFCIEFSPMLLCFVVLVPFIAWDAVRFAHRLVGPLIRFRKTMKAVTAGEPVRPIRLRQGDYLVEFQDDFNAMLSALQQRGLVPTEEQEVRELDPRTGAVLPVVSDKA